MLKCQCAAAGVPTRAQGSAARQRPPLKACTKKKSDIFSLSPQGFATLMGASIGAHGVDVKLNPRLGAWHLANPLT